MHFSALVYCKVLDARSLMCMEG